MVRPLALLLAGLFLSGCAAPVAQTSAGAGPLAGLPVDAAAELPASHNPVLPGDFPDPSVIRAGDEYWASATSSEWAPAFPLLRSHDLYSWHHAGAVFPTPPAWSEGSYWAPELTADNGRYQVYYTARKRQGPLCVAVASAERPAGPYRDHGPLVCHDDGAIDGSTIRDEYGARYLIWKEDGNSRGQPTPLFAQPLDAAGTALVGERRELLRNDAPWEGALIEGPFILRRGAWFYLFYSGNGCCGTGCSYALGVARSQRLLGPWEKHPRNPILTSNDAWRCPGHGSVVASPAGRSYLLYHAYARRGSVSIGRQGLVDEVRWGSDGWPSINDGRGPSGSPAAASAASLAPNRSPALYDFIAPPEQAGWQWPVGSQPRMRVEGGAQGAAGSRVLVLVPPAGTSPAVTLGAVLGRTAPAADYRAITLVDQTGMTTPDSAGLAAYGDRDNALGIAVAGGSVVAWRRQKGAQHQIAALPAPGPRLYLQLSASDGHRYQLAFSRDGQAWTRLGGEQDGGELPPWDRGVRVALTASGTGGRFAWLRITPQPAP